MLTRMVRTSFHFVLITFVVGAAGTVTILGGAVFLTGALAALLATAGFTTVLGFTVGLGAGAATALDAVFFLAAGVTFTGCTGLTLLAADCTVLVAAGVAVFAGTRVLACCAAAGALTSFFVVTAGFEVAGATAFNGFLAVGAGALFLVAAVGFARLGFGATFCFDSPVFLAAAAGLVAFFPADGVLTVFGAAGFLVVAILVRLHSCPYGHSYALKRGLL